MTFPGDEDVAFPGHRGVVQRANARIVALYVHRCLTIGLKEAAGGILLQDVLFTVHRHAVSINTHITNVIVTATHTDGMRPAQG